MTAGIDFEFDEHAMGDIADWVATEGSELMFIYGEYDPWTAGAFDLGNARDSFRLFVAGGNHGADIEQLSADDRELAFAALERWTGVKPSAARRASTEPAPPRDRLLPLPR